MEKRIVDPTSVIIAREARGLTQKNLAEKLSISQSALSKIEFGISNLPVDLLPSLSEVLEYPEDFFYQNFEIFRSISMHRKRLSLNQKSLNQIDASINIIRAHIMKLLQSFDIEVRIPTIDPLELEFKDKSSVASELRQYWNVAKGPIKNLTALLERNGIIVFPFDFGTKLVDGLSFGLDGLPPIIFVNNKISGDRYRFTLAHELGHILLHKYPKENMEEEANIFASEFLLPRNDIKYQLEYLRIERLIELKIYWKVSMAAILLRAKQLGELNERQYRYFWINFGKLGYRLKEPIDIPIEESTLIKHLIDQHLDQLNLSIEELQKILLLHKKELFNLYLGHRRMESTNLRIV